ncbi:unnamed protein product [Closterium sp. NIES-64]|nr:unnamed protein product [Closterium sp. NIES-64]
MESRLAASSGAVSSNRACEKAALVSTSQSSAAPSSSPRVIPKSRSSGALLASCPIPFKAGVSPLAPPAESFMTASSSLSGNQTVATDPFSRLPDDVVIEILSHLGGGAPDVLAASMTCRRWQSLTRAIPVLRFVPRDTSRAGGSDCASTLPACSAIQREELVSRMISLRLPASLEHVDFAYLRAESCAFITASSLRSVSIRDMFVRSVTIQQAPRLRYFAIASASLLEVSAPESCEITTLDLKAGSFCWSSLQSLLRGCGTALSSLALDFFTAGSGALSSGIFSLFWLAAMCPALRALNLGSLPWQLVLSWATTSGALQPAASSAGSAARWPQLEELKLKVQEQRPEALLLLHALLSNVPTLKSLQVATAVDEEEEDEEEVEEEEEEEEDEEFEEGEECEDEDEEEEVEEAEEYEGEYEDDVDEDDLMEVEEGAESSDEYDDEDESMPVRSGGPAVQRHMSRQELFLKGLVCLQQRFSDVNVFLPLLARRSTS